MVWQNLLGNYIKFLLKNPKIPGEIAIFTRALSLSENPKNSVFEDPALRNSRLKIVFLISSTNVILETGRALQYTTDEVDFLLKVGCWQKRKRAACHRPFSRVLKVGLLLLKLFQVIQSFLKHFFQSVFFLMLFDLLPI